MATRIELDLRIGFAFTRFLTNSLRMMGGPLAELVLSYGRMLASCSVAICGILWS